MAGLLRGALAGVVLSRKPENMDTGTKTGIAVHGTQRELEYENRGHKVRRPQAFVCVIGSPRPCVFLYP